jgi:hypothetical protein
VSGKQSSTLAGEHADLMIAIEPRAELGEMFDAAGGRASRGSIPSGADVGAVTQFADAGFTDLALVQIGGDQQDAFLDWAPKELLLAFREV